MTLIYQEQIQDCVYEVIQDGTEVVVRHAQTDKPLSHFYRAPDIPYETGHPCFNWHHWCVMTHLDYIAFENLVNHNVHALMPKDLQFLLQEFETTDRLIAFHTFQVSVDTLLEWSAKHPTLEFLLKPTDEAGQYFVAMMRTERMDERVSQAEWFFIADHCVSFSPSLRPNLRAFFDEFPSIHWSDFIYWANPAFEELEDIIVIRSGEVQPMSKLGVRIVRKRLDKLKDYELTSFILNLAVGQPLLTSINNTWT